ncbi:hypothetical protein GUITHDRAFT_155435 [Guillardia theta CCMP2712]|uniref:Uncharacterized protein n=1 Tax=Guillardia theta (strain CCMP2712) TaxID=905079 RepID=L1IHQ0_GUITC|nr:hypothetical protein GUITHDRAFT_155435 [Guillardia theta CCMP2712]EKX35632.1 hypothetical protein GUITHDRAFT_155435 [Guillardia theta CCMP2712]|eukprot:XP_005822612.1 hypothetical protein GUITHDRAFT_155435 [Guillardia theta CCMP2712]
MSAASTLALRTSLHTKLSFFIDVRNRFRTALARGKSWCSALCLELGFFSTNGVVIPTGSVEATTASVASNRLWTILGVHTQSPDSCLSSELTLGKDPSPTRVTALAFARGKKCELVGESRIFTGLTRDERR